MKNNYRKLKFSVLLQTLLVTALTVLVGGFLLNYVIDGIYNDSFAKIFVDVLMRFHVDEQTAIDLYWTLIGDNKTFYMIVGFLLLFAAFLELIITEFNFIGNVFVGTDPVDSVFIVNYLVAVIPMLLAAVCTLVAGVMQRVAAAKEGLKEDEKVVQ